MILKAHDTFDIHFGAGKDKADYKTHPFVNSAYYDGYIQGQMSEFNNAYTKMRIDKVVAYITMTVTGRAGIVGSISKDVHYIHEYGRNIPYLWHYNYDGKANDVMCNQDYIDKNCLKFLKNTSIGSVIRKKVTWLLRPKNWLVGLKGFENYKFEDVMVNQASKNNSQYMKVICFGPMIPNQAAFEDKNYYSIAFNVKVNYSYHMTFTGMKSKCPGFATLKEKPAGFKTLTKGDVVVPYYEYSGAG